MTELLVFEWRRMRSLRATWVLAGLMVGFALLADLAVGLGKFKQPVDAEGLVFQVVQRDLVIRWLVAAAIGAQGFGHDFRYDTIRPTLLAFPRTGQLLAGKVLATSLLSATAALAASAASVALLLVLTTWDGSVVADMRLWGSVGLGIVMTGLVAALAVGLAALARGSGLAVVLLVLWAGVVEPLTMVGLGGGAARVLPFLSLVQLTAYAPVSQDLGAPGPLAWVSSRCSWRRSWPRRGSSSPDGTRPHPTGRDGRSVAPANRLNQPPSSAGPVDFAAPRLSSG